MADTQPAAEAPATNPAEATKSNGSTEAQAVTKPDATESAESGDKEGTNGTAEAAKGEESSSKEKDGRSDGRQFDNRRGGRGGRGGGNKSFRKYVDLEHLLWTSTYIHTGAMTNSRTCPSRMTPTRLGNK